MGVSVSSGVTISLCFGSSATLSAGFPPCPNDATSTDVTSTATTSAAPIPIDSSFFLLLFGFSGYLILSLVVVYPLLYGYCASLYPAYGLIAEKLFRSKTMLENMPDSSLIFEPLRLLLVYILYFLGRRLAKKRAA